MANMLKIFPAPPYYIAFSLAAAVCLAPIINNFNFDDKRIVEVMLILITLISLAGFRSAQLSLIQAISQFRNSSKIALIGLVGLGILSAYLARQPEQAFIEVITLFSLLLMAQQSALTWQIHPRFVECLLLALILSLFALEVKFLASYMAFLSIGNKFLPGNFFTNFDNVRFFNQYQMWLLPVPTFVLLVEHSWLKKPWLKKLLWFIAIVWWIMFFTTCGRGVIVAFIVSVIATFYLFGRHASIFLKSILLFSTIGFLFQLFLFSYVPVFFWDESILAQLKTLRSSTADRLGYLWPVAIGFIRENPFLGIGPMHYAWFPNKIANHPHNSILQWGCEWGLPALFLALFLICQALKAWAIRFNKATLIPAQKNLNLAVISLSFSLFSAMTYSLFCGVIVMPMSHLTGALIVSLMFAMMHLTDHLCPRSDNSKPDLKLALLFAFIAIGYFRTIMPDAIPRLLDPNYLLTRTSPDVVNKPRFWVIGEISK